MSGALLGDDEDVVRYCKSSALGGDGLPLPDAFRLRRGEDYLSVNWLGFFGKSGPGDAVEKVRRAFRSKGFHINPNGQFFALSVRETRAAGNRKGRDLRVEHRPSPNDKSHAGVFGYTILDDGVEAELALAARRRRVRFPANSVDE